MIDLMYKDADNNWKSFLDIVYPVGSVYISYTSESPANRFGGTWSSITGRFPYFNAGIKTGGSNTHTLSPGEMPKHCHSTNIRVQTSYPTARVTGTNGWLVDGESATVYTGYSGSGQPHNNMPAYQTLYAWRRTD